MRKVKLKSDKELLKLGYDIPFVSDDGEFMHLKKKGGGITLGLWRSIQHDPHVVVDYDTVHVNQINLFPDAWEEVT